MNREKLIKGLEETKIMLTQAINRNGEMSVTEAFYCFNRVTDALTLLKELEPRVMTLEELKQFVGHPCWFESSGTYRGKDGFWIIPAMFRTFSAGIIMSYTSVLDGLTDYGELGLSAYNKAWRCWTDKPAAKQRQMVK